MKITAIRIRKLVSTRHGHGHNAVEFTAAVEEGDNPLEIAAKLRQMVDLQIHLADQREGLMHSLESLKAQVEQTSQILSDMKDQLNETLDRVDQCGELFGLAVERGIDVSAL